MNKAELRKLYLGRQRNLVPTEREKTSRAIAARFFAGFDLSTVKYLHCFLPIEKFNEIETKYIFERLWHNFPHIQTIVPRVNFQTMEMESLQFAPGIKTALNAWHINEPLHHEFIAAEKIDLILVPLLCFDQRGFRVGYGKGFYDRFLRICRPDCLKIGLSYFSPVEMVTDAAGFDVTLDYCQTPENTWRF